MNWSSLWRSISKSLLLLTFFLPFVVMRGTIFPTVFGKSIFYRSLIELALISLSVCVILAPKLFWQELRSRFTPLMRGPESSGIGAKKNIVLMAFAFFVGSVALATIFAHNPYVAFWGQLARDEGLLIYIHLLLFVVMSFFLFEKEDWKLYVSGIIISSTIVSIGAWIQYFGGSLSFPIELKAETQPGSLVGNPAYLASFMIIVGALFTGFFEFKKFSKKYLYIGILLMLVSTVLITGIRGAFLGLCAGVLFFLVSALFKKDVSRRLKSILAVLLVLGSLLVGTFVVTRSNQFWLSIPTVKRFATLSLESNSLKSRLSSWESGIKGFLARPITGWGPEGFRYVMNNYGDPADAAYTDTWIDRAHNKIIDIAAMHGSIGLIAYLGLITSMLWVMRKNILFCAFLVAYFVQNLFVFDSPVSYAVFAAVVALVASNHNSLDSEHNSHKPLTPQGAIVTRIVAVICIVITVAGMIMANIIPLVQQRYVKDIMQGTTVDAKFGNLNKALYPFTALQLELRPQLVERLTSFGSHADSEQRPYFNQALAALEEVRNIDPDDPHIHLALTNAYAQLGVDDPRFFNQAEKYARESVAFAPYQQKFYTLLSYILFKTGKVDEAIEVAQKSVDIAPNVGKSYLNLALPLLASGKEKEGIEAIKTMARLSSIKKNGEPAMSYNDYGDTQYQTFDTDELMNAIILSIKAKEYTTAFNLTSLAVIRSGQSTRTVTFIKYRLVTGVMAQNSTMVNDTLNIIEQVKMTVPFSIKTLRDYVDQQNWVALRQEPALATLINEFNH